MKSIYNETDRFELIERINMLTPGTLPQWGKMNISGMMAHCTVSVKIALGEIKPDVNEEYLRLGKLVKNKIFDYEVFTKELPTSKEFMIKEEGNFDENREILIEYINRFANSDCKIELNSMHPYLGILTMEEWGKLIWKHTNHHLIQFNV
jgi:hypothetical protein